MLEAGEDEIVVDNIETGTTFNKEFMVPPHQILGLHEAVLESIDRCRKYLLELLKNKMRSLFIIIYFSK